MPGTLLLVSLRVPLGETGPQAVRCLSPPPGLASRALGPVQTLLEGMAYEMRWGASPGGRWEGLRDT